MSGKSTGTGNKPKLAGLDDRDLNTAQTDMPHTYFAGVARLNIAWAMNPVIAFTKATPTDADKGK